MGRGVFGGWRFGFCFIKLLYEFLFLDGFKRVILKERFLNIKMIFLKIKLLKIVILIG